MRMNFCKNSESEKSKSENSLICRIEMCSCNVWKCWRAAKDSEDVTCEAFTGQLKMLWHDYTDKIEMCQEKNDDANLHDAKFSEFTTW